MEGTTTALLNNSRRRHRGTMTEDMERTDTQSLPGNSWVLRIIMSLLWKGALAWHPITETMTVLTVL